MAYIRALVASAVIAHLTGCASPEAAERAHREAAACTQRGEVWYTAGYRDECVSAQEARRRDELRWVEEQREKDREAALEQACIRSGGTSYSKWTGCMKGPFAR